MSTRLRLVRLLDRASHRLELADARAACRRLVYDVGEHTCGGYGPESGYAHEPECGFEPVLRLDKLEGWPGEKPLDGEVDRG